VHARIGLMLRERVEPRKIPSGLPSGSDQHRKLSLKRTKSRAFDNGNVYSCYAPTE
jgi:hypothetical protein